MSPLGVAAAAVVLLGRADPRARAGALRVREAVRRQGAALLARLRAAHRRHHLRRDRIPAVGDPARRLRAPARRGSRAIRSRPSTGRARWRRSRCGSATASSSPGRCSTCCWRCSSTSSTSPASARCCRRPSGRCCPTCPPATAGLLPGDRVESVDGHRSATGRSWTNTIVEVGRQDAALRDPARARRRGARRHARSRSSGRARCGARSAWDDWREAALPPARDRRARSVVAGRAGRSEDVRLHHRGQRRSRRDLGRVRQGDRARRRVAAAPQLRARRLLGGAVRAHRDRGARLRGGHPGRRVRRAPGAAATRPASCRPSCSSSPSSPAAPPTGSASGAATRSWRSTARRWRTGTCCARSWRAIPTRTSTSAGCRGRARATRPASARRSGRSWT